MRIDYNEIVQWIENDEYLWNLWKDSRITRSKFITDNWKLLTYYIRKQIKG